MKKLMFLTFLSIIFIVFGVGFVVFPKSLLSSQKLLNFIQHSKSKITFKYNKEQLEKVFLYGKWDLNAIPKVSDLSILKDAGLKEKEVQFLAGKTEGVKFNFFGYGIGGVDILGVVGGYSREELLSGLREKYEVSSKNIGNRTIYQIYGTNKSDCSRFGPYELFFEDDFLLLGLSGSLDEVVKNGSVEGSDSAFRLSQVTSLVEVTYSGEDEKIFDKSSFRAYLSPKDFGAKVQLSFDGEISDEISSKFKDLNNNIQKESKQVSLLKKLLDNFDLKYEEKKIEIEYLIDSKVLDHVSILGEAAMEAVVRLNPENIINSLKQSVVKETSTEQNQDKSNKGDELEKNESVFSQKLGLSFPADFIDKEQDLAKAYTPNFNGWRYGKTIEDAEALFMLTGVGSSRALKLPFRDIIEKMSLLRIDEVVSSEGNALDSRSCGPFIKEFNLKEIQNINIALKKGVDWKSISEFKGEVLFRYPIKIKTLDIKLGDKKDISLDKGFLEIDVQSHKSRNMDSLKIKGNVDRVLEVIAINKAGKQLVMKVREGWSSSRAATKNLNAKGDVSFYRVFVAEKISEKKVAISWDSNFFKYTRTTYIENPSQASEDFNLKSIENTFTKTDLEKDLKSSHSFTFPKRSKSHKYLAGKVFVKNKGSFGRFDPEVNIFLPLRESVVNNFVAGYAKVNFIETQDGKILQKPTPDQLNEKDDFGRSKYGGFAGEQITWERESFFSINSWDKNIMNSKLGLVLGYKELKMEKVKSVELEVGLIGFKGRDIVEVSNLDFRESIELFNSEMNLIEFSQNAIIFKVKNFEVLDKLLSVDSYDETGKQLQSNFKVNLKDGTLRILPEGKASNLKLIFFKEKKRISSQVFKI